MKNRTPGNGGAICFSSASALIRNCLIKGNAAHNGGGLFLYQDNSLIFNCIITENNTSIVDGEGGGICCWYSTTRIINCLFQGNKNLVAGNGGAMTCNSASPEITNCTFTKNAGGSFSAGGIEFWFQTSSKITNCIFWNNSYSEISGADPEVTFSDIRGGYQGQGNINADPVFSDSLAGDFTLRHDSPCIDTGDPSFSVPYGGGCRIDMGAFEFYKGFNYKPHLTCFYKKTFLNLKGKHEN